MKVKPRIQRNSQVTIAPVIHPRSPTGFTFPEFLVILVIIGILAAIGLPSWMEFMRVRRISVAQDRALQALELARTNAKRDKRVWQTSFREFDGAFQWAVHPLDAPPTARDWQVVHSQVQIDDDNTTLYDVGGVWYVKFDHMGLIDSRLGRLTLTSEPMGKAKRCVFVSTWLGALRRGQEQSRPDSSGKYCY